MSFANRRCQLSLSLLLVLFAFAGSAHAQLQFAPSTVLLPSTENDWAPSRSSNNLTVYFSSNTRTPRIGDWDIWQATRPTTSATFGTPTNLGSPLNSSVLDGYSQISFDGLSLVFQSERAGGHGGVDLYISSRANTSDMFGTPVNLGANVNSAGYDGGPDVSVDGLTLVFDSFRTGEGNIYMATRPTTSAPFGTVINLGSTINTSANEYSPSLSRDGLTLFFASNRSGGLGGADIWMSTRSSIASTWGAPVNLGPNVNSPFQEDGADIAWDGSSLAFRSDRANPGGRSNLYEAAVIPEPSTLGLAACGMLLAGFAARYCARRKWRWHVISDLR
jgi:Tol biopolymer transport system component